MLDEFIIRPYECALVIALPLTQLDFLSDAAPSSMKDFVKQYSAEQQLPLFQLWENYSRYAALAKDIADEAEAANVTVLRRPSLDQWRSILGSFKGVTLFAHWKEDPAKEENYIEFVDGLHSIQDFVSSIPKDYCGVLDLTICHSMSVAPGIKQRSPLSTVIVNKKPARLDYRLSIYRQVLRLIVTGNYSYVKALSTVQLAVLNKETRWSPPTA